MTSALGFRIKPKYDRHKYLPLPASGEVQNVQNSTVYIFGDADIAEEEINTQEAIELPELRTRNVGGKRKRKTKNVEEVVCIEKEIKEGDTLLTFALQYGCPVSELKRINNLMNDQDFFARRSLKVPMRQHGLLLEGEERDQINGAAKSGPNHIGLVNGHRHDDVGDEDRFSDSDDSQTEFVRTISIPGSLDGENKAAQAFFNRMDKDLHLILEKTPTHKDSLEEVTSVLKETRFRPLAFPKAKSDCPNDGATLGCTVRNVVIAIIFVGIVIPLVGLIYELNKDKL